MFGKEKAKLINENEKLTQRIKDLEFKICQGKHSYVRTGESRTYMLGFDFEIAHELVCLNCNKKIWQ